MHDNMKIPQEFTLTIILTCLDSPFKPYKYIVGSFTDVCSNIRVTTENARKMTAEYDPELPKIEYRM